MNKDDRRKILHEIYWLIGIGILAAALEYTIIILFDLHPILSVKLQAFIGLLIIAYVIRMVTRVWKSSGKDVQSKSD